MNPIQRNPDIKIIATIALLFGTMTIVSGGFVLFGPESLKVAAGKVVNFVLWFNFLAGFLYLLAGLSIWQRRHWAINLSAAIALMTALVLVALILHIASGSAYEARTVTAMTIRLGFWVVIYF